jgi:hypothetical protein
MSRQHLEAARILYRHGSRKDSCAVLAKLWETRQDTSEFEVFLALAEITSSRDLQASAQLLRTVIAGEDGYHEFWERRSLAERATLYDWYGQIAYRMCDMDDAYESLSRAASLGRDTTLLWRLMGQLCLERDELELGLRYLIRSLHLYRQLSLDILTGRDHPLGGFSGEDPLKWTHDVDDYMRCLLQVSKMAKGRRNLKSARELLMEMMHQFPNERRLPQLRLLVERSIVNESLTAAQRPRLVASP